MVNRRTVQIKYVPAVHLMLHLQGFCKKKVKTLYSQYVRIGTKQE